MRRYALPLALVTLLALPVGVRADFKELDCITDIVVGTTIDFEEYYGTHEPVNTVLVKYDMLAVPNKITTTFVSWVVGHACAPIGLQAGFGDNFRLETTGDPWDEIGMSVIGTILYQDMTFTLYAYDKNNQLLGSFTREFKPGSSHATYNAAAQFMGVSSTTCTAIYALRLVSTNGNIGWDHIRYHPYSPPCPGDFDCDGDRDFDDIDPFVAALGSGTCACPNFANCDPNGDGKITFDDIDPFIVLLGLPCP